MWYTICMKLTFSTAQIAKLAGVHPNTVRFYEEMGLLPRIPRKPNGYRVFTPAHLRHLRLIRTALRCEILSDNLRLEALAILKAAAAGSMENAILLAEEYCLHIRAEQDRAWEAIELAKGLLAGDGLPGSGGRIRNRREAAELLGISRDVLRDWCRNGLVCPKRQENGYLAFDDAQINRLKVIRALRNAHYSQMSILRMLRKAEQGETALPQAIDTPDAEEDIITVTDRYLSALAQALEDAYAVRRQLMQLQKEI